MDHADLGRHDEPLRRAVLDEREHLARAEQRIGKLLHRLRTLRMGNDHRIRMLSARLADILFRDQNVRGAIAGPENQIPTGLLFNETPQVLIGHKNHGPVPGQGPDDRDGIGAGAAVVAFGFHLGHAVDVADDERFRMLAFETA